MNRVQKSSSHTVQAAGLLLITLLVCGGAEPPQPTPNPFESPSSFTAETQIDKLVFAKLKRVNLQPANVCSDAVFVRRAYLDVIGTLPTGHEAREFLLDQKPDKRRALIDRLLEREGFADFWAMKWSDLLRVKAT